MSHATAQRRDAPQDPREGCFLERNHDGFNFEPRTPNLEHPPAYRRAVGSLPEAALVLLVVLAAIFLCSLAEAADFGTCSECHQVTLEENRSRRYLHSPFAQRQCGLCHAAGELSPSAADVRPLVSGERHKIQWLGESTMLDTAHWFVLPGERVRDTLVVEARGRGGPVSQQEIRVPPLAGLVEAEDGGRPPVISGPQLLGVQRGLFLSAAIGWETDTVADARVRYGDTDLGLASPQSSRFGRRHEVMLYDLRPNRTYRVSAVSSDVFGRQRVSGPMIFSTSNPAPAPDPLASGGFLDELEGIALTARFQRVGESYLLELTADRPAAVSVGTQGSPLEPGGAGGTEVTDDAHAGLSSKIVISIQACQGCHERQLAATHPVNVYPRPGMIVPAELSTLPDGRITCVSCHQVHGSNYEFLLARPRQRELCVSCHRDRM